MGRIKINNPSGNEAVFPELGYFYSFKGKPMVHIKGNFMKGGFSMSLNKARALTYLLDQDPRIKAFLEGEYDDEIANLPEGEGFLPEEPVA